MKLSKWLTWYWGTMLVSAVLGVFDQTLLAVLAMVASIVQLYALAKLRPFHRRIGMAFTYTIISLITLVVTLVLAVIGVSDMSAPYMGGGWIGLLLIVLLIGAVCAILSAYNFYWALDELIETNGYDYPQGRIRWCFYIVFIRAVVNLLLTRLAPSAFLISLCALAAQIVALILLWQYLQAVKIREQQDDFPVPPEL